MKNICIIPARGGSKRIPRKNIKDFLGKPIISYSIEAALSSGIFDEIMVSTEDEEVKKVAIKYGANVPFLRSKKNANDFATTFDVIEEVLSEYEKRNTNFDNCCCIYPCAPLVTSEFLLKAYDFLKSHDSVLPVIKFSYPIQRALRREDNGAMRFYYPEFINMRSQDLETTYHDSGQFYWFNINCAKKESVIITKNSYGLQISELDAQDIDNESDWVLAEIKFKMKKSSSLHFEGKSI